MSAARFAKVMGAQMKAFLRDDDPHLLAAVSETDCAVWHFLAAGLGDELAGGEYLFRLTAPNTGTKRFPFAPPRFEFLTPNGVFVPGGAICISIGEFHADSAPGAQGSLGWRPALGLRGFAREVVSGMVHADMLGAGIRIDVLSAKAKKKLARASRAFNRAHFPAVVAAFEEFAADHPDRLAVAAWTGDAGGGAGK